MDRKIAIKEWRDVTCGAPEGVPTGRTVHAFAQRVEELVIAGHDKRHSVVRAVGGAMANFAYNLAQRTGQPLSNHDTELLDRLRKEWDEALRA